jgi:hypothetical protein
MPSSSDAQHWGILLTLRRVDLSPFFQSHILASPRLPSTSTMSRTGPDRNVESQITAQEPTEKGGALPAGCPSPSCPSRSRPSPRWTMDCERVRIGSIPLVLWFVFSGRQVDIQPVFNRQVRQARKHVFCATRLMLTMTRSPSSFRSCRIPWRPA